VKKENRTRIARKFELVNKRLEGQQFLMDDRFTVADAYMFVMLTWAKNMQIEIPANLSAYFDRLSKRPCVQQALSEEGLQKAA
jgi:glutathione S-transferase